MTVDPLRTYVEARKTLDRATRQLTQLGATLRDVGEALREPPFRITTTPEANRPPSSGGMPGETDVDLAAWPDGPTLARLLADYQSAAEACRRAAAALSTEDRDVIGVQRY